MRYLFLILVVLAACNPTREQTDTTNYDVISEKCYVIREHPNVTDSTVNASREQLVKLLKENDFPVRYIVKDSVVFRRKNGLQVELKLPPPQDAWESNTIIVFDPAKNPLFVNLHKGTAQVEKYINEK
jgi:hypothetical protein